MNNKALKSLTLLMAGTMAMSSCIGSFGLFNKVLDWNQQATGNKFLNWLIFILISPAYVLCGVADMFVINSIEFWSGSNPLAENIGKTENIMGSDGKLYAVTTLEDGYEVKGPDGKVVNFKHNAEDDSWSMVQDGKTTKLLKMKGKNVAEIYLKDGGSMDVSLNEQGIYNARMAVNGGIYYAFNK